MKKRRVIGFALILLLVNFSLVSASFILGNSSSSIGDIYSPGESLRGWINISIQQEPGDSLLASDSGGSIRISDLLNNLGDSYSCFPDDCMGSFVSSNPQAQKKIYLGKNDTVISFLLNGRVSSINSLSFDADIENAPSCFLPASIKFFEEDSKIWNAWKFGSDFSCTYAGGKGCFDSKQNLREISLDNIHPFCEKITLVQSGRAYLGAWIRRGTGTWGDGLIKMQLYSLDNTKAAECNLPEPSPSGGETGCIVNYNITSTGDYYVCLRATNALSGYTTETESSGNTSCGFYAEPGGEIEYHDYYIFGRSARFENTGTVRINSTMYSSIGGVLLDDFTSYLDAEYNKNCTLGCSVPIRFTGREANITLSNLALGYSTGEGSVSSNNFYDAKMQNSSLSSNFLSLDLGYANLTAPTGYGNHTITISLGGTDIVSKEISVAQVPVIRNIVPRLTQAGVNTKFSADVYSPSNSSITIYSWDFGDGTKEDTSTNYTSHIYSETGIKTLKLEVEDSNGYSSSNEFTILVGNPKDLVNSTLKDYRSRINSISSQIASEPAWHKTAIESELDLNGVSDILTALEKKFSLASSDSDYANIMSNLSEMSIPRLINISGINTFPVLLDTDSINFDYLSQLGAGNVENLSEEDYKSAIVAWFDKSIDANADYYTVSAVYDQNEKVISTFYKLRVSAKEPSEYENYMVVNKKIDTSPDENIKEFTDSTGFKFNNLEDRETDFAVAGEGNPLDIGIYFSPMFRDLELGKPLGACNYDRKCEAGENWKNCLSDCKPWGWVIFFIIAVLFLAGLSYLGLQWWYRARYESHLFKNKNDLFNLVNFISNAMDRGMKPAEIAANLRKLGWHSEQITYAFKKVKGKKTGMPLEIKLPGKPESKGISKQQNNIAGRQAGLAGKQEKAFKP